MKPGANQLRKLYETDRMTTRQIGAHYGVSKTEVSRWMRAYGIPPRPKGQGLDNRGVTAPTPAELEHMIHVEHLSYREIADKYGVDFTAVPYWLTKHGIRKPKIWETRRKGVILPDFNPIDVLARYHQGESSQAIAQDYGVEGGTLRTWMRDAGIELRRDGWQGGKRHQCADGHEARSLYELRVDDWLSAHGLDHEVEPTYPWDRRYRADFKVGDTYIEVWGVTNNDSYAARRKMKIEQCAAHGIPLISINHWQFARGRQWWRPLKQLQVSDAPHGLHEGRLSPVG